MTKGKKLRMRHIRSDMDAVALMVMTASGDKDTPDLLIEVISSAMKFLKSNPKTSIEKACEFGVNEWIK